jgi:hypothetical protein
MPGLLRGMARTAAVVGTATATRNAINRRQAEKNAMAYSQAMNDVYGAQPQVVQSAPPPPAEPTPAASAATAQTDPVSQLERLAALRDKGVLTEQEFQTEKAKVLAL